MKGKRKYWIGDFGKGLQEISVEILTNVKPIKPLRPFWAHHFFHW
jgi:hypothetical protein